MDSTLARILLTLTSRLGPAESCWTENSRRAAVDLPQRGACSPTVHPLMPSACRARARPGSETFPIMPSARRGLTLIELLVIVALVGLLIALLLPAVQMAREAARRTQCGKYLRQIGVAVHEHHNVRRMLPSGWMVTDAQQQPGWGWAAQLVWYLEEQNVLGSPAVLVQPIDVRDSSTRSESLRSRSIPRGPDPTDTVFKLPIAGYATTFTGSCSLPVPLSRSRPPPPPNCLAPPCTSWPEPTTRACTVRPRLSRGRTRATESCSATVTCDLPKSSTDCRKLCSLARDSSRLGGTTWIGVMPAATSAMTQVVGTGEHVPNDVLGDLATFGSYHIAGVQFLYGDGSVHLITDEIDLATFQNFCSICRQWKK